MAGSGLPSGSGGEESRGEGARESTRTETEAMRSSGETLQPGSGEPMQTAPEDAETRRGLKRSAELPIDDPRSEVRGRGLHLDDDVPIVTPTVQQTEHSAGGGCGRSPHEHGKNGADFKCSYEDDERSSEM